MRTVWMSLLAALLVLASSGCKSSSSGSGGSGSAGSQPGAATGMLNGEGATFPAKLYEAWAKEYSTQHGVKVNYTASGSGKGIKTITDKTTDFGASDAPMSDKEIAAAPGILHIPTTVGAVVVAYNVKGAPVPLKLTPEVLAGIFLGDIKNWDDPKIAEANDGAKIPPAPIAVVHRSDGSGTTAVFTEYLSKVSPAFKEKIGQGKEVPWAKETTGAKGNDGVLNQIRETAGAVGYIELAYALEAKPPQPFATLKNKAGKFVVASPESISAAAAGATLPDDLRVSIVDAPGDGAYPISAFTYVLVYTEQPEAKGAALANFLWWALHDGQKAGPPLHFAELPPPVVAKAEEKLKLLKAGGKALLPGK